MKGAVIIAIVATIGNMLQGWDNATIAGAVLYIKREFHLEGQPTIEGLIVATSLIGATVITTFSGPLSDSVGRRPMLIASSVLYFVGGLVMLWSPNVYMLLVARLLDGFGIGLAVTLVPLYISETAPSDIRGQLNTLPQFMGSGGMFMSYCMVFSMSLMDSPSWRIMLGVLSIPSLIYFFFTVLFLPESPRWLVSKGRMSEATKVLQRLRGTSDVQGELALLVEGLGVGTETSVEEYVIGQSPNLDDMHEIKLYKPEEDSLYVGRPMAKNNSLLTMVSRNGSLINPSNSFVDPTVNLFGSIHEKLPRAGSMLLPTMGSTFGETIKEEDWDIEKKGDAEGGEAQNNLRTPLLSRQGTEENGDNTPRNADLPQRHGSSLLLPGEEASATEIGGGWKLAYKKYEKISGDGQKEEGVKRLYLHQDAVMTSGLGSMYSVTGGGILDGEELVPAVALASQSAIRSKEVMLGKQPIGRPSVPSPQTATAVSIWKDLCEPGIKRALFVGVGIQILQQFSGINGVLYYTPQILEQAGVGVLLSNLGIRPDSASLLISGLTTLLMLPSISIAMRLMDVSGRRALLLGTIPILIASLLTLIFGSLVTISSTINASISTASVILYFCSFVMGFGPIPNILCSEIFPTRVRGACIAITALTFWICDIIVTYTLPIMLSSIGLAGVFSIYATVCIASWIFVFLQVPETKGMPLEVISEFFAVGARQAIEAPSY
ncbi:hypothetical protein MLD38_028715 [Melastoma candidum]|uniref:Uncharacterized protein n=1 Tax=Melastoma candidum TaxID=119954 RepID=A0ACB9N7M8_9MYRT|nr:hypothetical protein MLD38_028715 [Melastoma candidum]